MANGAVAAALAAAPAYRAAATTVLANYQDYQTALATEIAAHGNVNVPLLQQVSAAAMQPALDNYRAQLFTARTLINGLQAQGLAHYNPAFLSALNGLAATMAINVGTPQEVIRFESVYLPAIGQLFDVYNIGYNYDRAIGIGIISVAALLAALALAIKKRDGH